MKKVKINTEYIKLDQLLKHADVTASGGESKILIMSNLVKVNGIVVTERGKKIRTGDKVSVDLNGKQVSLIIEG